MAKEVHSRAYHRYFEDYAEKKIETDDGEVKMLRVYVGKYYRQDISDRARILRKTLYAAIYVIMFALFIIAGTRSIGSNSTRYIFCSMAISFLALLWLALPIFFYVTAKREMEIRSYRESSRELIHVSRNSSICLFITTLCSAIYLFSHPSEDITQILIYTIMYLLAATAALGIHIAEKRLNYVIIPPKQQRPEKSSPIKFITDF